MSAGPALLVYASFRLPARSGPDARASAVQRGVARSLWPRRGFLRSPAGPAPAAPQTERLVYTRFSFFPPSLEQPARASQQQIRARGNSESPFEAFATVGADEYDCHPGPDIDEIVVGPPGDIDKECGPDA